MSRPDGDFTESETVALELIREWRNDAAIKILRTAEDYIEEMTRLQLLVDRVEQVLRDGP